MKPLPIENRIESRRSTTVSLRWISGVAENEGSLSLSRIRSQQTIRGEVFRVELLSNCRLPVPPQRDASASAREIYLSIGRGTS
jgi:hypothetical protein